MFTENPYSNNVTSHGHHHCGERPHKSPLSTSSMNSNRKLYSNSFSQKLKSERMAIKGNAKNFEKPFAVSRQQKFKQAQESKQKKVAMVASGT